MSAERIAAGTLIDAENPWPGLGSFDEGAQHFFSGRDAESAELLRLVSQAPLTVLFGKSGLGKTSLLEAGLFPQEPAPHPAFRLRPVRGDVHPRGGERRRHRAAPARPR